MNSKKEMTFQDQVSFVMDKYIAQGFTELAAWSAALEWFDLNEVRS